MCYFQSETGAGVIQIHPHLILTSHPCLSHLSSRTLRHVQQEMRCRCLGCKKDLHFFSWQFDFNWMSLFPVIQHLFGPSLIVSRSSGNRFGCRHKQKQNTQTTGCLLLLISVQQNKTLTYVGLFFQICMVLSCHSVARERYCISVSLKCCYHQCDACIILYKYKKSYLKFM